MAARNNLHIPEDLLSAVNEAASADGKTLDEVAADALRRSLAHRKLEELGEYGRDQARKLGYTEADVPRLIAESRHGHRDRKVTLDTNIYVAAFQFGGMRLLHMAVSGDIEIAVPPPTVDELIRVPRDKSQWDGYRLQDARQQVLGVSKLVTPTQNVGRGERG
jgi:hypothetical protein